MDTREQLKTLSLDLLREIGSCPAVPFMEQMVASAIERTLQGLGVPVERDRYGNLIAHCRGRQDDSGQQPPIAFVAHMDHPGFEALESRDDTVVARVLGGVPQACYSDNVPVQIVLSSGDRIPAETAVAHETGSRETVSLRLNGAQRLEFPAAVVLDLPDYHFDGSLIHMRALDDLAGCVSILAALKMLMADDGVSEIYAVFTRAEEVGLIGARLVAEQGLLPEDTIIVSLEASRTLPGAAIGEGPIIRVGDASFTFDAEAEAVLLRAGEDLMAGNPEFKVQRQLMSGGTCEASAFRYYGYPVTGIAFPLGNYHNATPDGGVGAEYIHLDDFIGGVQLLMQSARAVARRRESRPWRRMRDIPQDYRRRLSESAGMARTSGSSDGA